MGTIAYLATMGRMMDYFLPLQQVEAFTSDLMGSAQTYLDLAHQVSLQLLALSSLIKAVT